MALTLGLLCLKKKITAIFQGYLAHTLHFRVFIVEVLLKLGEVIQVPSLLP